MNDTQKGIIIKSLEQRYKLLEAMERRAQKWNQPKNMKRLNEMKEINNIIKIIQKK